MEMYKMGGSCRDAKGLFFCILPYAILTIKTLKNPAFYTLLYIQVRKSDDNSFLSPTFFCNFAAK